MEPRALLRVGGEPFFITGRGVGVIGTLVEGSLRFAWPATVAIPGGPEGVVIEHVACIESARVPDPPHELPGMLFGAERGSERAELLLGLLRPGTLLTITGPAVISPADGRFPARTLV